jgi:hypothetical protein
MATREDIFIQLLELYRNFYINLDIEIRIDERFINRYTIEHEIASIQVFRKGADKDDCPLFAFSTVNRADWLLDNGGYQPVIDYYMNIFKEWRKDITKDNLIPVVGKWYDYANSGSPIQCIGQCEDFYHFDKKGTYEGGYIQYGKNLIEHSGLSWKEWNGALPSNEQQQDSEWNWSDFSEFSRLLAATKTKAQLESILGKFKAKTDGYRKAYYRLRDNQSSTQSKSQQRAHALNNLNSNLDSIRSYENALQLHELFPQRCKQVKH